MSLIVQKYGGTSVGSLDRIQNVADWVIRERVGCAVKPTHGKRSGLANGREARTDISQSVAIALVTPG
jgi:hypothetical protein